MDAPASSAAPPPPPDAPVEAPRGRSGGQKRKSASSHSSSATPAKRLMKERNALNIHSSSPLHSGPVTRARQSPSKIAASAASSPEAAAASAAASASASAAAAASCPAADGGRTDGGGAFGAETEEMAVVAEEPIVDLDFDAVRSRGSDVHVVPVPAGWFSWKDIHPIEKHTLASFFNGKLESRTPEIYMEIRNSIMKKFHADPQTQLELKDLYEISVGDTEARQEVMEFLAHWGLINFHPFLPSNPELDTSNNGEDKTSSSLVEKLYKFDMVQTCPRILAKKVEVSMPAEMPKSLPESTVAEDLVGPVGPSVEYHCNSCSADCSRKRYHCPKEADYDLCIECYNNGKFDSGMTPADFILMEPAEFPGASGGSWTDQETLLLLEALELFEENWNEIAEHVATKSKAQCILHFLQMSIEDSFLDGSDDSDEEVQEEMEPSPASKETDASCVHETKEADNADGGDQPIYSTTDVSAKRDACELDFSCENGSSLPIDALKAAFQAIGLTPEQGLPSFVEVGNPIMALAAFLTHLVEPYAATTSTRSSLKAMSEESPGIQLATRHCFILENPPDDMKDLPVPASESAVTDMDIAEAPKEEAKMPTSSVSDELKAPNGTDEPKASNVSDELKPLNASDELKPSNGTDVPKPSDDSDGLNPSNISDELQPCSDEVQPSKCSDLLQPSEGSAELKCSNGNVDSKTSTGDDQSKPSNGSGDENDCPNKNEEGAVPVENETQLPVTSQDCLQETPAAKESGDLDSSLQEAPSRNKESNVISEMQQISPSEDTKESASPMILSSTNTKESGDKPFQGEVAQNIADETNVSEAAGEEKTDSVRDLDKVASVDEIEAISGTSMIVDTKLTSAPSEEPESQQKFGTDSAVDNKETEDGDDKNASPCINENSQTPTETNADHKINKLKRAAATVLSAAAVKAKLLANQEEDQIRQLVSLVIGKQLQKLDAKLALFNEIESVIMRVREQTEKARQRLVHERAQIIAARFGLPVPPARANLMSPPGVKLAAGYATTGSKPPTMASQKMPPMRRP